MHHAPSRNFHSASNELLVTNAIYLHDAGPKHTANQKSMDDPATFFMKKVDDIRALTTGTFQLSATVSRWTEAHPLISCRAVCRQHYRP